FRRGEACGMTRLSSVWLPFVAGILPCALLACLGVRSAPPGAAHRPERRSASGYGTAVLPVVKRYCLTCHSSAVKRGGLDLARFTTADLVRGDVKPWQGVIDHLEVGDMPPR